MGAVYRADPVRKSVTSAVTAVLAVLTIAAGGYFAVSAARGVPDPRPDMQALLDRLVLPPGAALVTEHVGGGVSCDDAGCPTVERWWALPGRVEHTCPAVSDAVAAWGGIRFERLGSAECGYVGILGAYRLSFSAVDANGGDAARLPHDVVPPEDGSVLYVGLTRA